MATVKQMRLLMSEVMMWHGVCGFVSAKEKGRGRRKGGGIEGMGS